MSIFEGLIKPTVNTTISPAFNSNCNMSQTVNIENYHNHYYFGKPLFFAVLLLCVVLVAPNLPSCSHSPLTTRHTSLESQVRQWASDYPADLRNRWAWCYLDSVANFSTEQKLREDVRLKSVQVLTDSQREVLVPLDRKIDDAVPKQTTPLVETYHAIGMGLKVTPWTPPDEGVRRQESEDRSEPPPRPPIRRGIFNRR